MLTKAKKGEIVSDLEAKVKDQKVVLFSDFHGLGVAKQQELRRILRKENAEYKVAKKTLIQRAFDAAKLPFSFLDYKGELAVIFGFGDEVAPAKMLAKFAKANPDGLKILGGLLGGKELTDKEVASLAKLPGKAELIAQLAWTLSAPMRGLVTVLNGNQRKLVVVLQKIKESKS